MIKKSIKKLDLDIYEETLENGLKIFVVPKLDVHNVYATFSTKYGSKDNEFIPINENEMIKVPDGIAHFLEHKLFEQKKGLKPFDFYSKTGADCNANTSYNKTTYLFVGQSKIKENLNYLLDFVSQPYFTDKNVEKEKGIIEQEIKMYQDDPESNGFEKLLFNIFNNNPIRIPVGGTVESIAKITKEHLYTCYNTFYHPSNMFVVITGNVNPKEIIDAVKENQKEKMFIKPQKIKLKEIKEPDEVYKKHETLNMNVTIPKLLVGYKINIENLKLNKEEIDAFASAYLNLMFGSISMFSLDLIKEGIINRELSFSKVKTDKHLVLIIEAYTNKKKVFLDKLNEYINNHNITSSEFNREKKVMLSSTIYMSDNIYRINSYIMNHMVEYNKMEYNPYDFFKNLTYNDFNKFIKALSFENYSTIYIKNS